MKQKKIIRTVDIFLKSFFIRKNKSLNFNSFSNIEAKISLSMFNYILKKKQQNPYFITSAAYSVNCSINHHY